MTTTVKVHVNGNYRATVTRKDGDVTLVGPNEEKQIPIAHPVDTGFTIVEEYLGDQPKAT